MFLITVGIYLVTGSLYVFLISEKPQYWNEPKLCRGECGGTAARASLAFLSIALRVYIVCTHIQTFVCLVFLKIIRFSVITMVKTAI